uniref:Uncharacterized protein n=1 Tax=Oryza sativa subsp. japonica TaxID=39947 RepID=Q2QT43_ORYSJ|nr:hypothetical protein LOC_Os12g21920 [Oryza sativa Japonica Group]
MPTPSTATRRPSTVTRFALCLSSPPSTPLPTPVAAAHADADAAAAVIGRPKGEGREWEERSRSQRTPSPPNSESPPKANWGIASNNCYSRMIIASAALTSDRRMSNACDRMLAAVIPSPTAQPHAGHKGRDVCVLGYASPCPCPHLAGATAMNAT